MNQPGVIDDVCVGCGCAAPPIPTTIENKGPYCPLCAHGDRPPKRPTNFPTAFSSWDHHERAAMRRVIDSGLFTMGKEVAAFEREFADYHGMSHGIMVNSGSSANLVGVAALAAIGHFKEGDKVMVPALAWPTTYAPLVQHGLELVLIDCDHTWNMNIESRAFCDDARLIVGASILGNGMDAGRWATAAGVLDAVFMEDNCESLGARCPDGRLAGTSGLVNTFSFFYSHQISAIEGGMILTNDDDVANYCRMLRNHGWSKDVDPPQDFESEYDFRLFGYNVRPLELHAAIAREQLKKLDEFIGHRQTNMFLFRNLTEGLRIHHPEVCPTSPFALNFTVHPQTRPAIVEALRAEQIDCRLPTGGSLRLHHYGQQWHRQFTPQADAVHVSGLFIGNPPWPAEDWIEKAAGIIRRVVS